jgi:F0F1-type ATP synthase membrane subunit c/vacuolar-type H+-ATPase subunit K
MPDDFIPPPQQLPEPPPPLAGSAPTQSAGGYYAPPGTGYGYGPAPVVAPGEFASSDGPAGRIRPTGICILLMIVTLGIYGLVWYFMVHDEMRRHTGQGLGGVLALVIAILFGIVMPFLTSNEVGGLDERVGRPARVTALTALWYFPGMFILVGPIIWFVKTNGALNDYWRSVGAVG